MIATNSILNGGRKARWEGKREGNNLAYGVEDKTSNNKRKRTNQGSILKTGMMKILKQKKFQMKRQRPQNWYKYYDQTIQLVFFKCWM
jgi:hypothetical protein